MRRPRILVRLLISIMLRIVYRLLKKQEYLYATSSVISIPSSLFLTRNLLYIYSRNVIRVTIWMILSGGLS